MVSLTRRATLGLIAGGLTATALGGTAAARTVHEVVSIPEADRVPENLAFDADGNLVFGLRARSGPVPPLGEIRRLPAALTQETGATLADTTLLAGGLPGNVIGVEVAPDGTVYFALTSAGPQTGLWALPPAGSPALLSPIPGFPNDLVFDAAFDRVLVTESFGGAVYAVDPGGASAVWSADPLLDTPGFGANGLTIDRNGDVVVAVSDAGRLVRVPVNGDGTAGAVSTVVESPDLVGADGVTARGPQFYVGVNARNTVVRVNPAGRIKTVLDADDGLVFPSDVLFGTAPRAKSDLFVCNFAVFAPEESAIFRTNP